MLASTPSILGVCGGVPVAWRTRSSDGARQVVLGAAQQRVVLAMLLLNVNRPVSVDLLTDALWGERPPPTSGSILQNRISELRRLLGPIQ